MLKTINDNHSQFAFFVASIFKHYKKKIKYFDTQCIYEALGEYCPISVRLGSIFQLPKDNINSFIYIGNEFLYVHLVKILQKKHF